MKQCMQDFTQDNIAYKRGLNEEEKQHMCNMNSFHNKVFEINIGLIYSRQQNDLLLCVYVYIYI